MLYCNSLPEGVIFYASFNFYSEAMNIEEYIGSGIIETYCLGFTNHAEDREVETYAAQYPGIKAEINKVRESMLAILQPAELKPRPSVKSAVMNNIYTQQSFLHPEFVPLMHKPTDFARYFEAARVNKLVKPLEKFDNIVMQELPSTIEVINFAVWVKQGHEEELHDDRKEFIAILEGSCDMIVAGKTTSYTCGQIITVPLNLPHHAVITSPEPMFALVQRQLEFN